jgi:hypothetical protein
MNERDMEYTILSLMGWHAAPMFKENTTSYGVRPNGELFAAWVNTTNMEEVWRWGCTDPFEPTYFVECPHDEPPVIPAVLRFQIRQKIEEVVGHINERVVCRTE